jgi:hypothetical protein
MRYLVTYVVLFVVLFSCKTTNTPVAISDVEKELFNSKEEKPVSIANDTVEYEIIIIEPGFDAWLNSIARPKGYYGQTFLENRNKILVAEWNRRALNSQRFNPNLYEMQINYDPFTDYGYDVNYKLYNYFIYFQRKYNQRLGPFVPRI